MVRYFLHRSAVDTQDGLCRCACEKFAVQTTCDARRVINGALFRQRLCAVKLRSSARRVRIPGHCCVSFDWLALRAASCILSGKHDITDCIAYLLFSREYLFCVPVPQEERNRLVPCTQRAGETGWRQTFFVGRHQHCDVLKTKSKRTRDSTAANLLRSSACKRERRRQGLGYAVCCRGISVAPDSQPGPD